MRCSEPLRASRPRWRGSGQAEAGAFWASLLPPPPLLRFAHPCGAAFGWRQNTLRHSYASYRLADTPVAARVALEMGNSPEKLFRDCRELVTLEAAKEWFAIMPESADLTRVCSTNPHQPTARR